MPNIGLVLAGGFAKGAYQIGVLKAIKEYSIGEHISCISAASIGALNAYAFAHDKMEEGEEMWRSYNFSGLRSIYATSERGSFIYEAVSSLTDGTEPTEQNLYVPCLNLNKVKLNYVNLKDVKIEHEKYYLLACVTLPMLSLPVKIAGTRYFDGAIVDNTPVKPLMNHQFDYAIVVHFDNDNFIFENEFFDSKLVKVNFLDEMIIKNSLAFNRDSIACMIDKGYEVSMSIFDIVFKNGLDDLEYITQKIRFLRELRGRSKFRLTGDVVMNNMNSVMKKIIKYKI